LEDLVEWITDDVKDGYVDSSRADGYIGNIEGIMKRQQEIINERNS
jgi:C4-type Zn-finger protein